MATTPPQLEPEKEDRWWEKTTPRQVLTDPNFYNLPPQSRKLVLEKVDPEFAKLAPQDMEEAVSQNFDYWQSYYAQKDASKTYLNAAPKKPSWWRELGEAAKDLVTEGPIAAIGERLKPSWWKSTLSETGRRLPAPPDQKLPSPPGFDTPLSSDDEKRFQLWATKESTQQGRNVLDDLPNYDLRGFWKAGANWDQAGHAPDTWKKPSHPTFSEDSMYHGSTLPNGDVAIGGRWGSGTYTPSSFVAKQHSVQDLQDYFAQVDPSIKVMPPRAFKMGAPVAAQLGAVAPEDLPGYWGDLKNTAMANLIQGLSSHVVRGVGTVQAMANLTWQQEKFRSAEWDRIKGLEGEDRRKAWLAWNLQPFAPDDPEKLASFEKDPEVLELISGINEREKKFMDEVALPKMWKEYQESWATQFADQIDAGVNRLFPQNPAYAANFTHALAAGAGFLGAFAALGGTASILKLPRMASIAGLGAITQVAQPWEEAVKGGATPDELRKIFVLNLGLGATEAVPVERSLQRLDKATGGWVTRWIKSYARRVTSGEALKGGAEEMIQEFVQQLGGNLGAKYTYDPEQESFEGVGTGALAGFILGGLFGGLMTRMGIAQSRSEMKKLGLTKEQIDQVESMADDFDGDIDEAIKEYVRRTGEDTVVEPKLLPPAPPGAEEERPGGSRWFYQGGVQPRGALPAPPEAGFTEEEQRRKIEEAGGTTTAVATRPGRELPKPPTPAAVQRNIERVKFIEDQLLEERPDPEKPLTYQVIEGVHDLIAMAAHRAKLGIEPVAYPPGPLGADAAPAEGVRGLLEPPPAQLPMPLQPGGARGAMPPPPQPPRTNRARRAQLEREGIQPRLPGVERETSRVAESPIENIRRVTEEFWSQGITPVEPEIPDGMARLYRAQSTAPARKLPGWVSETNEYRGIKDAAGRWFTQNVEVLEWYIRHSAPDVSVSFIDIPETQLDRYRVANQSPQVQSYSRDPYNEFYVPKDLSETAAEVAPPATSVMRGGAAIPHTIAISSKPGGMAAKVMTAGELKEAHDRIVQGIGYNPDTNTFDWITELGIEHTVTTPRGWGTWEGIEPNMRIRFPENVPLTDVQTVAAILGEAWGQDAVAIGHNDSAVSTYAGVFASKPDGSEYTIEELDRLADTGVGFETSPDGRMLVFNKYWPGQDSYIDDIVDALTAAGLPGQKLESYKGDSHLEQRETGDYRRAIEAARNTRSAAGLPDIFYGTINRVRAPWAQEFPDFAAQLEARERPYDAAARDHALLQRTGDVVRPAPGRPEGRAATEEPTPAHRAARTEAGEGGGAGLEETLPASLTSPEAASVALRGYLNQYTISKPGDVTDQEGRYPDGTSQAGRNAAYEVAISPQVLARGQFYKILDMPRYFEKITDHLKDAEYVKELLDISNRGFEKLVDTLATKFPALEKDIRRCVLAGMDMDIDNRAANWPGDLMYGKDAPNLVFINPLTFIFDAIISHNDGDYRAERMPADIARGQAVSTLHEIVHQLVREQTTGYGPDITEEERALSAHGQYFDLLFEDFLEATEPVLAEIESELADYYNGQREALREWMGVFAPYYNALKKHYRLYHPQLPPPAEWAPVPIPTTKMGKLEARGQQRLFEAQVGRLGELPRPPPAHPSTALLVNPLFTPAEIEAGQSLYDIAKALEKHMMRYYTRMLPPGRTKLTPREETAMTRRFVDHAGTEVAMAIGRNYATADFYTEDLERCFELVPKLVPSLANEEDMDLFKVFLSILSPGHDPLGNLKDSILIYDLYRQDGVVPIDKPGTKSGSWGSYAKTTFANPLQSLQNILNHFKGDVALATEWLLNEHPVSDLKRIKHSEAAAGPTIWGTADELRHGSFIFGEKVGAYYTNINGLAELVTKDRWFSRAWNRLMGTVDLVLEPDEEGVYTYKLREGPRNYAEVKLMNRSSQQLAKYLKITPSELQSAWWFYEKSLYAAHGGATDAWSYADAAEKLLEEEGIPYEPRKLRPGEGLRPDRQAADRPGAHALTTRLPRRSIEGPTEIPTRAGEAARQAITPPPQVVQNVPRGKEGECFRNAGKYAMELEDAGKKPTIVHGKVTNLAGNTFWHAWVELENYVLDPTTGAQIERGRYYTLLKALPVSRYTPEQNAVMMLRNKNWGPWGVEPEPAEKLPAPPKAGGRKLPAPPVAPERQAAATPVGEPIAPERTFDEKFANSRNLIDSISGASRASDLVMEFPNAIIPSSVEERPELRTITTEFRMDKVNTLPVLLKDIANQNPSRTMIYELMQNSLDAIGDEVGAVDIRWENLDTEEDDRYEQATKGHLLTFSDNGSGMTAEEIKDFFLVGGSIGKSGTTTRGGYGMAKIALLLIPDRVRLTTTKNGVRSSVDVTRDQIYNGQIDIHPEYVSDEDAGKSGTTFEAWMPKRFVDQIIPTRAIRNAVGEIVDGTWGNVFIRSQEKQYSDWDWGTISEKRPKSLDEEFKKYPTERFEMNGSKVAVHYIKAEPYGAISSWANPPMYRIDSIATNKGLAVDIRGAKLIGIGTFMSTRPDFKIVVDFEKTPDVRSDFYPFLKNRTEIMARVAGKITDVVSNRIRIGNAEVLAAETARFQGMLDNSPSYGGTKVVIPYEGEIYNQAVKILQKHEPLIRGIAKVNNAFTRMLENSGEMNVNFHLTIDPKVFGFMTNPEAVGVRMYAINPFQIHKRASSKILEAARAAGQDENRMRADLMAHVMVHEYTHFRAGDHAESFTNEIARLYTILGHQDLADLATEFRRFYEQYGSDIESALQDFGSMETGGTGLQHGTEYSRPHNVPAAGEGGVRGVEEGIGVEREESRAVGRKLSVREETFQKLIADIQRGKPERAMLKVQGIYGGGVLNPVVEHVGDIIHRMTDMGQAWRGYGAIEEAIQQSLWFLNNPYGFQRELAENIRNNAQARRQNYLALKASVDDALKAYADAHAGLPVFNEVQMLARDASVAIGRQNWSTARANLQKLRRYLKEGPESWMRRANQFDPTYENTAEPVIATEQTYLDENVYEDLIDKLVVSESGKTGESRIAAGYSPRLIDELCRNLYKGKLGFVATRETLSNAVDACRPHGAGNITVDVDTIGKHINISDDGIGMTPEVMKKELVDISESYKPGATEEELRTGTGTTGTFGLAKAPIFGNALKVRVVSRAKVGNKVIESVLTGTGEDWKDTTKGMRLSAPRELPGDTPTGTSYDLLYAPEIEFEEREIRNFFGDLLRFNLLPKGMKFDLTVDGSSINRDWLDEDFLDSFEPLTRLSVPGADIDIYIDKEFVEQEDYIFLNVLNNGLYQFGSSIHFPDEVETPYQAIVNIKSTEIAGQGENYPFTPSREDMRGPAQEAINKYFTTTFWEEARARELDRYIKALTDTKTSPVIPRWVGSTTKRPSFPLRVIDTENRIPVKALKRITGVKGVGRLIDLSTEMLNECKNRAKKFDSRYTKVDIGGLGLGSGYLGININLSLISDHEKLQDTGYDPDRRMILLNPFRMIDEIESYVEEGAIEKDDRERELASLMAGAIEHEIIHQTQKKHGNQYTGELTRFIGRFGNITDRYTDLFEGLILEENLYEKLSYIYEEEIEHLWSKGSSDDAFSKISGGNELRPGRRLRARDPEPSQERRPRMEGALSSSGEITTEAVATGAGGVGGRAGLTPPPGRLEPEAERGGPVGTPLTPPPSGGSPPGSRTGAEMLDLADDILSDPPKPGREPLMQRLAKLPSELRERFITRFEPLDELQKTVYRMMGLPPPQHPISRIFELIPGAPVRGEHDALELRELLTRTPVDTEGNPTAEPISKTYKDWEKYVFYMRTIDRLINQDPDHNRQVSDITLDEARRALKELENRVGTAQYTYFFVAGQEYQQIMDKALRLQVTSGRMSEDQYEEIKSWNDFYAPFVVLHHLENEAVNNITGLTRRMATREPLTRTIKGILSEEPRIADIAQQSYQIIMKSRILAAKNEAMMELDRLADMDKQGVFIQRIKGPVYLPPKEPDAKGTWYHPDVGAIPEENLIPFKRYGENVSLVVNPRIRNAVQGQTARAIKAGMYAIAQRATSKVLHLGATTFNVGFQPFNLLAQDLPTLANLSRYGIQNPKDFAMFWQDVYYGLISSFSANMPNYLGGGKYNELYRKAMESGILNSTFQRLLTPEQFQPKLGIPSRTPPTKFEKVRGVLDSLTGFANAVEETTKLAAFRRGMRMEGLARVKGTGIEELSKLKGKAREEAMQRLITEVRNFGGSPDFPRHGSSMPALNLLFMFLNARIQGMSNLIMRTAVLPRRVKEGGKTKWRLEQGLWQERGQGLAAPALLRLALMVGLPTFAASVMNYMPGYRDDWEKVSDAEKRHYWMVPLPSHYTNDQGEQVRNYLRFPLRDMSAVISVIAESMVKVVADQDPAAFGDMALNIMQELIPVNLQGRNIKEMSESIISGMNPIYKAPLEVLVLGRDTYRHRDIEPGYMSEADPWERYRFDTPDFYIWLGKLTRSSPEKLKQAADSLTGGFTSQFVGMGKTVGDRSFWTTVPAIKRFYRSNYIRDEEDYSDWEEASRYDATEVVVKNRAAETLMRKWQDEGLSLEEKLKYLNAIVKQDRALAVTIRRKLREESLGRNYDERRYLELGVETGARATFIANRLSKLRADQRKEYLDQLIAKRIITGRVMSQIERIEQGLPVVPGLSREERKRFVEELPAELSAPPLR